MTTSSHSHESKAAHAPAPKPDVHTAKAPPPEPDPKAVVPAVKEPDPVLQAQLHPQKEAMKPSPPRVRHEHSPWADDFDDVRKQLDDLKGEVAKLRSDVDAMRHDVDEHDNLVKIAANLPASPDGVNPPANEASRRVTPEGDFRPSP